MKVAVDLDGVLVDMCGGIEKRYGIHPYSKKEMYGTFEFDDYIRDILHLDVETFWDNLDHDFWANLETTKECFNIIELVETLFGKDNISLMTSPVYAAGCITGKFEWVKKHLPRYFDEKRLNFVSLKHFMAHKKSLLIDDKSSNVTSFCQAGGHAILVPRLWNHRYEKVHKCFEIVEKEIKSIYTNAFSI